MADFSPAAAIPGAHSRPPGIEHLEVIARGGFAAVYRGWQPAFNRWVAVKCLAGQQGQTPGYRFEHEVRAVGSLSEHPHVVPVYEAGEVDGHPYLVMPYLTGGSLQHRMAAGPVAPGEAVATAQAVADALAEAHRLGILHRDIKPANILFTAFGVPQLADFGVARLSDSTLTGGLLAVTVSYAAPEVLSGERATPRSDVYSLGATLYAALRGVPPYSGVEGEPAVAHAMRIVHEQAEPLRRFGVPAPLAEVVERAMAKDPAERYQSAAELRDALAAVAAQVPPGPVVPAGAAGPAVPAGAVGPVVAAGAKGPAEPAIPAATAKGSEAGGDAVPANPPWPPTPPQPASTHPQPASTPPQPATTPPSPASTPSRPPAAPHEPRHRRALTAAAVALILAGTGTAVGLSVSGGSSPASRHTSAPTTRRPAPSPAPQTTPTTARASGSTSAGGGPPTAGGATSPAAIAPATLADTLRSYYTLVDQHRLDQAWQWLSPAFQQRIGQAYYRQFWNSISQVQVLSVHASGGAAAITLRYVGVNGATSTETADLGFRIGDQGRILIDTDRVTQG